MPKKTRIEREIDEILEKSGDVEKPKSPRRRRFEPFSPTVPKRKSPIRSGSIKINPGTLVILGVAVLAVAAFNPVAKLPLAIAGALMVVVGYVLWFRPGGRSLITRSGSGLGRRGPRGSVDEPQAKYWRGRRIEEKPKAPDVSDSGGKADRGKIIEFGPPDEDPNRGDRD